MFPRFPNIFLLLLTSCALSASGVEVTPGDQPLSVNVAGHLNEDGQHIHVSQTTLTIAPPQFEDKTTTAPTPGNYQAAWDGWLPWPKTDANAGKAGAITLSPRKDENGVLMLGLPYRQYPPEQIVVQSADGSKTYQAGRDYKLLENYSQIANLDNGLGQPLEGQVKVSYREVEQRLDLVQVDARGKASIKQGESRFVCPYMPEPDAGCIAVAGIYVAPWLTKDSQLSNDLIFPIAPKAPVAPVNPDAVSQTRAKLEADQPISIAYMGDSITLGAEAGQWWRDDTQYWRGRFQRELKKRYPNADIAEIPAWRGGRGIDFGAQQLRETVLPAKPDLLIIMMGMNDSDGPSDGSRAKVSPADFGKHLENIVKTAQDAGIEVILMTSMQPYPMKPGGHAQRWPEYVSIQKEIADKHDVGLADTYQEWMNLQHRGMPPYSQLHNWNNHPGSFGHSVLAEVPLRFFPGE